MIFRQITHDDLGCASYLIGDEKAGIAAVVDPRLDIEEYLHLARYMGVTIQHIFETHNHADHVSGHGPLVAATGAIMHVHRGARPAYAHEPFDDGDEFQLGTLTIRALHTPGHRPEHTAFALIDTRRGPEPWAVLTGDTLFVNDVARPDLAIEKSEGARGIFESLHTKLLTLPANCEIWPGHLGGSMCGGPGMDMKVSSTIGFELAHNPVLQIEDEDEFVTDSLSNLGAQPPNFQNIVALNKGPLRTETPQVAALHPHELAEKIDDGALLIDVRPDPLFDDAHIAGSVSIPMVRAGFGTKLAWLADIEQEVVFVGDNDQDGQHAAKLANAIGLSRIGGYLREGISSWAGEKWPLQTTERLRADDLCTRLEIDTDLQLVDVRDLKEWNAGHVPGSVLATWYEIKELPDELDPERPIAVICGSGQRAATASSLLRRLGAMHVIHVVEGGVPKLGQLCVNLTGEPEPTPA